MERQAATAARRGGREGERAIPTSENALVGVIWRAEAQREVMSCSSVGVRRAQLDSRRRPSIERSCRLAAKRRHDPVYAIAANGVVSPRTDPAVAVASLPLLSTQRATRSNISQSSAPPQVSTKSHIGRQFGAAPTSPQVLSLHPSLDEQD